MFLVLFLAKIDSRLTLFYLANDVIQHSKKNNYEFVDSWGTTLQKATTLVRDDKVKEKISRIFNIWETREIYSEDFIADLHGLLAINPVKKTSMSSSVASIVRTTTPVASHHQTLRSDEVEEEFQLSLVVNSIRSCVALESETDKNLKVVVKTVVPDMEKTRSNLKGVIKNSSSFLKILIAIISQIEHMSMRSKKISTRPPQGTSCLFLALTRKSRKGRFFWRLLIKLTDFIATKDAMSRKLFT